MSRDLSTKLGQLLAEAGYDVLRAETFMTDRDFALATVVQDVDQVLDALRGAMSPSPWCPSSPGRKRGVIVIGEPSGPALSAPSDPISMRRIRRRSRGR